MDTSFIGERISSLRISRDVSEYEMSLDLGFSKSYIQKISSGRSLPSMGSLFKICDYFGISPKEFFDPETTDPPLLHELYEEASGFTPEKLKILINLIREMKK